MISSRIRHCALSPHSHATFGAPASYERVPVLLPLAAFCVRLSELFSRAAVVADWVVGKEGVVVVYTRCA